MGSCSGRSSEAGSSGYKKGWRGDGKGVVGRYGDSMTMMAILSLITIQIGAVLWLPAKDDWLKPISCNSTSRQSFDVYRPGLCWVAAMRVA